MSNSETYQVRQGFQQGLLFPTDQCTGGEILPLYSNEWIKRNSLPPDVSYEDAIPLLRKGMKMENVCEILKI